MNKIELLQEISNLEDIEKLEIATILIGELLESTLYNVENDNDKRTRKQLYFIHKDLTRMERAYNE